MTYKCSTLREGLLYFASEYAKQSKDVNEWWCRYLNWIKSPQGISGLSEEIEKRAGKKIGNDLILAYKWLKENSFTL